MSIPFYIVEAHGGQVITFDDDSVVKDLASSAGSGGNSYAPFVLSAVFDMELDGGFSRFRRAVQHVHADGGVTVDIVPYRDDQESGNAIQKVMTIGDNPIMIAPVSESGTNFQVKVTVSSFDASVDLGKALQFIVPRRSSR